MALAMDTYLTTDEVAAKMRVSRAMVVQLIDRGKLPATRFGRLWRIKEADLVEYLNRNASRKPEEQKGKRPIPTDLNNL
jgi:excisionase family DNA binding protein